MRTYKKGFVLIMVMIFMILTLAGSAALYISISANFSVGGMEEDSERAKGYYAAVAGLRQAALMLDDAAIVNAIPSSGNTITRSIKTNYSSLYNDLVLQNPHDVSITIRNNGDGTYTATASYS